MLGQVQPLLRALDGHVRLLGRWRAAAEGRTAAAIAHRLGCSVRTVGKHTGHLYRKLGVGDRLSAVLEARRRGILCAAGNGG